jgi:hypothetical protein
VSAGAWAFVVSAVLLPLLLAEFGDWCPWLAERIVRWSARRLGQSAARIRYEEVVGLERWHGLAMAGWLIACGVRGRHVP